MCFGSLQNYLQSFAGIASLEALVISAESSLQWPSQHQCRLENEGTSISKAHLLVHSYQLVQVRISIPITPV